MLDLQRVFWRTGTASEIKECWLTTVIFGMASEPHCAVRAMVQCARDQREDFPHAAQVIQKDFYMDDCITGASDETEARNLSHQLKTVLANGGFSLDKWHSNSTTAVSIARDAGLLTEMVDLSGLNDTTVLGLRWSPKTDDLTFKLQEMTPEEVSNTTKRRLPNYSTRMGTSGIGPVIVTAKLIMQRTWKAKPGELDWDKAVPDDIAHDWLRLQAQLPTLVNIRIPRWLGIGQGSCFSLHGFADASELAYGAVVYVRVERNTETKCMLLASRSRVAPVKLVTTPRLGLTMSRTYGCAHENIRAPTAHTANCVVDEKSKRQTGEITDMEEQRAFGYDAHNRSIMHRNLQHLIKGQNYQGIVRYYGHHRRPATISRRRSPGKRRASVRPKTPVAPARCESFGKVANSRKTQKAASDVLDNKSAPNDSYVRFSLHKMRSHAAKDIGTIDG